MYALRPALRERYISVVLWNCFRRTFSILGILFNHLSRALLLNLNLRVVSTVHKVV